MARAAVALAPTNDTDANFRLWGKAFSDNLLACGFVKTADTGQIDWATVLKPTVAATSQGYEIWRSDDATVENGLNNFVFKVEYGSGQLNTLTPGMWFTVGWSSNGSGTINSTNMSVRQTLNGYNTGSATLINCNFSGFKGWFVGTMFSGNATFGFCFSVERTRTNAGIEQDELFVWGKNANTSLANVSYINDVVPRTGLSVSRNASDSGHRIITTAALGLWNSDKGISMIAPLKGSYLMESLNILGANPTNYTTTQTIESIETYGVVRDYLLNSQPLFIQTSPSDKLLQRWEA